MDITGCPLDGSLCELRYSNLVFKKYSKSIIRPKRPTYLYDLKNKIFYSMKAILPSICSYDGVSDMLHDLSDIDSNLYIMAPMYSTDLVDRNSKPEQDNKSQIKIGLKASLHNPNRCNAGDIQPLFGGKLKIGESELDGIIREIKEESTLTFKIDNIIEHSRHNNNKLSICYHSFVENAQIGTDKIDNYQDNDNNKDDPKRKVSMAIYGTARDIANRIAQIPMESTVGDNIIGIVILPIEVAINIDSYSKYYWKNKNTNKSLSRKSANSIRSRAINTNMFTNIG